MLQRLIRLFDLLCVLWLGIWVISFFGKPNAGYIVMSAYLLVQIPYGLLRWVLVGSPIPFRDDDEEG